MQSDTKRQIKYIDYLSYKANLHHIPLAGVMELTSRCNFNCKMCYIHTEDCNANEPYELSTEQWIEIAKKAKDAGTVFMLLTGGEPMLRKDFGTIYKALCEMGFVVQINSNGSLISDEIFELFEEYPPTRINITLYGDNDENYYNVCGVKAFDKVISNIKRLKKMNITVFINCSVSNFNCDCVEQIAEIAKKLNVRCKFATYMYPPIKEKSGCNNIRMSPEKAVETKLKIDRIALSDENYYDKILSVSKLVDVEENSCVDNSSDDNKIKCKAGKTSFWIDWKGNLSICGMLRSENSLIKKDFIDCWNEMREFSANIRLPAKCNSCKYKDICIVCAANCFTENGDFGKAPEYLCRYSEYYQKKAKEIIDKKQY